MAPNFEECEYIFKNGTSESPNPFAKWTYTGPISGVLGNGEHPTVITYDGCVALCGEGSDLYHWLDVANTITTWVLPVVGGLLLQAPFESNGIVANFFSLIRWIGSPISSLSCTLWNIKVSGKCALMVDMSIPYHKVPSEENSEFTQMRDSFYILAVMNQFELDSSTPDLPAHRLLRIALFGNSLRSAEGGRTYDLSRKRQKLARRLRLGRRRGVVPVFLSIGWFLCALGISIQTAFGDLGKNSTAHNLALGLLLGWFPVFILSSVVDRNPVCSDDVRSRLNSLLTAVRTALVHGDTVYVTETQQAPDIPGFVEALANRNHFPDSFFYKFVGQGRSPWHYGVAHPILAGIEDAYVCTAGRNWLRNPQAARKAMALVPAHAQDLRWFDLREFWQILSAATIVLGTVMGAFTISYNTPTLGLGCRSGGYMIFMILASANLLFEMLVWFLTSTRGPASWSMEMAAWLLKLFDLGNTGWLIYIVAAQTSGLYETCSCKSSAWAGQGGYIDFESADVYKAKGISVYWGSGTALSLIILGTTAVFITAEWCSQSHLNTVDYGAASQGLMRTMSWKRYTSWLRWIPNALIDRTTGGRRSLVWSLGSAPAPVVLDGISTLAVDEQVSLVREQSRGHLRVSPSKFYPESPLSD